MSTTATRTSSVGLMGHRLAREAGEQVLHGDLGHPVARAHRRRADVRHDQEVGRLEQRVLGRQRLGIGDVECRTGDLARVQREQQRLRIDDRAARGVDEQRGRLHARERGAVDQVAGLGRERDVQGHEVRALEQVREGDPG
jgi:hypothetical protein